jgi:hypothetical protein
MPPTAVSRGGIPARVGARMLHAAGSVAVVIDRPLGCEVHHRVITLTTEIEEGLCPMENGSNPDRKAPLPASRRSLTRREWVQRMLAGASAGIAAPGVGSSKGVYDKLSTSQDAPASTQKAAAPATWKPAFFDDYQNQMLVALAEKILPGSTGAQVNQFLDTALSAETQESQQKFVASLNALEGESLRRFTKPFIELSSSQMDEILTAASTAQSSNPDFAEDAAEGTKAGARPALPNLRDYFDHLKKMISMAYYSSEAGMKELGWTGDNFFESYPGCEHAGGHS